RLRDGQGPRRAVQRSERGVAGDPPAGGPDAVCPGPDGADCRPDRRGHRQPMSRSPLTIATAQSHVSADVRANGPEIRGLMRHARAGGASLAHFPEAALSGYTKSQIKDWGQVDWGALGDELRQTAALAGELGLWVVFGCAHRLTPPHRPHNSLYVV